LIAHVACLCAGGHLIDRFLALEVSKKRIRQWRVSELVSHFYAFEQALLVWVEHLSKLR
jgi:hypothetical protein